MTRVGPVDHIARLIVPWRADVELTECGRAVTEVPAERIVTVDTVNARVRDQGQQRAAFSTCMTCWETAERWHGSGRRNRLGAILRELEALRYVDHAPVRRFAPGESVRWDREYDRQLGAWERRKRFERELDAILALIQAHRAEFDGFITGHAAAPSLADARARRPRLRGVR